MTTANATTDGHGERLVCGDLEKGMKAIPLGEHKKDPWLVKVSKWKQGILSDLLTDEEGEIVGSCKYNLLAQHILSDGILGKAAICYGSGGTIRVIRCGGYEYRSDAYSIFAKRLSK